MLRLGTLAIITLLAVPLAAVAERVSDDEVRQRIIAESIANYSGSCACPYNRARGGSRCGERSAYSRPGGASPLCYPQDVSDGLVKRYRQRHRLN